MKTQRHQENLQNLSFVVLQIVVKLQKLQFELSIYFEEYQLSDKMFTLQINVTRFKCKSISYEMKLAFFKRIFHSFF